MKKVLFALTSTVMAAALYADAQFYEMDITAKTTVTKSGKVAWIACDCNTDENTLYRKQGTIKIKGAIWGCDCGTLIKGEPFTSATNAFGYFFWNVTDRKPLNVVLKWELCNRIDKSAKKVEAVWTLTSPDGSFHLTGAGFGTLKDTTTRQPCMLKTSWIKSMKGSCAGWMLPGAVVTTKATKDVCSWCEKIAGTPEVTASAPGLDICSTGGDCSPRKEGNTSSAAFGTWSVKYNKKASAALEDSTRVTEAYLFPSYVKAIIDAQ